MSNTNQTLIYNEINIDKMKNNNYDTILNRIKKSKEDNKLSHAFIVHGSDHEHRIGFAREAVKVIFGDKDVLNRKIDNDNFEDLLIVRKDGNSIKVEQIQQLTAELRNKPFSSELIATIIEDGDAMTEQSQNKLLKTLEEPSPGYVIIILVSNQELLLETIRSRCLSIKLIDEHIVTDPKSLEDAKKILSMALFQSVAMNDVFDILKEYETRNAELLLAMKYFLRDVVVGARAEELIINDENIEVARKLKGKYEQKSRECISIIEETSNKLNRGLNSKYLMRDMAVRIRQEGING